MQLIAPLAALHLPCKCAAGMTDFALPSSLADTNMGVRFTLNCTCGSEKYCAEAVRTGEKTFRWIVA